MAATIAGGIIMQGALSWREQEAAERMRPLLLDVVNRIRGALFQGNLTAFYASKWQGKLAGVSQHFWATSEADGVIESGEYEPLGAPAHFGRRYAEPLYLLEVDLVAFLGSKSGNGNHVGNNGNKPVPERRRRTQQGDMCSDAFAALYPGGMPDRKTLSDQKLVGAVMDHIGRAGGPTVSQDTILRAAGRRK